MLTDLMNSTVITLHTARRANENLTDYPAQKHKISFLHFLLNGSMHHVLSYPIQDHFLDGRKKSETKRLFGNCRSRREDKYKDE